MFWASSCLSSGATTTALAASGFYLRNVVIAVLLVVVGPARPRPTALLSPSSDGKPEAANADVVAPDDGHEDA